MTVIELRKLAGSTVKCDLIAQRMPLSVNCHARLHFGAVSARRTNIPQLHSVPLLGLPGGLDARGQPLGLGTGGDGRFWGCLGLRGLGTRYFVLADRRLPGERILIEPWPARHADLSVLRGAETMTDRDWGKHTSQAKDTHQKRHDETRETNLHAECKTLLDETDREGQRL